MSVRELRSRDGKFSLGNYAPSNTERALEEMCSSFGAELNPAYLETRNHLLLVRLSNPVVINSERLGKQTLRFQYTKFSVFDVLWRNYDRVSDVYMKNVASRRRKKPASQEEIREYICRQLELPQGEVDGESAKYQGRLAKVLINENAVKGLKFRTFPKEVYVAAYPGEMDNLQEPMRIHKYNPANSVGLPRFHVAFGVAPRFFVGQFAESGEKSYLRISWPLVQQPLQQDLDRVSEVCDCTSLDQRVGVSETMRIGNSVPRIRTMSFIRSFIRQSLDGIVF